MNIERTLFWFKDGDEQLTLLSDDFFGLATLLNRLLNDKYDGKRIKFINLDFSTDKTYQLYPALPKEASYYYGGHLRHYGIFDKDEFIRLSKMEQAKYIWIKAHKYLTESAGVIENNKLAEAADYAYFKGLEMHLNPDYKVVEENIFIAGINAKASVWINFNEDSMLSKITLERSGNVIFEKILDKTKKGTEFFLEIYKAIVVEDGELVIKGRSDVAYLPLRIPLSQISI